MTIKDDQNELDMIGAWHNSESEFTFIEWASMREKENHCKDCCCAQLWEIFGNPFYESNLGIVERVKQMKKELEDLKTKNSLAEKIIIGETTNMKAYKLLISYLDTLTVEDLDKDNSDFLLDALDTLWWGFTEEEMKELYPEYN